MMGSSVYFVGKTQKAEYCNLFESQKNMSRYSFRFVPCKTALKIPEDSLHRGFLNYISYIIYRMYPHLYDSDQAV